MENATAQKNSPTAVELPQKPFAGISPMRAFLTFFAMAASPSAPRVARKGAGATNDSAVAVPRIFTPR